MDRLYDKKGHSCLVYSYTPRWISVTPSRDEKELDPSLDHYFDEIEPYTASESVSVWFTALILSGVLLLGLFWMANWVILDG
jgi:hypothetical protein